MKNNILKLVKWFCRKLTYDDLSSAIVILHEVLCDQRSDIDLKPDEKPPHYREFRVDLKRPLTEPPEKQVKEDWRKLKKERELKTGKEIKKVQHRSNSLKLPPGCRCEHCDAPQDYLYLNDGKKGNQVKCKICNRLSPTHRVQKESKANYWCPYCGNALYQWKSGQLYTAYKCPNNKCSFYLDNLENLEKEEKQMIADGKSSQFKVRYQYREYQFGPDDITPARPAFETKTNLRTIRRSFHKVCLVLTYFVNIGLSSRQTRDILRYVHGINDISHQTVINYANAVAALICDPLDALLPRPSGITAGDETYINVENRMQYTWLNIDCETHAICGYNLSGTRGPSPCLSLLYNTFGTPEENTDNTFEYVADGLGSYDNAVNAYNKEAGKDVIKRYTVIGLKNLDPESEKYRPFKQMIERLNRTYKYHTRPRAGFKTFEGAVCLTVLFVAFYNFMRPHQSLKGKPPVQLECLKGVTLYQDMWAKLLQQA